MTYPAPPSVRFFQVLLYIHIFGDVCMADTAMDLITCIRPNVTRQVAQLTEQSPVVVLAFDEAHALSDPPAVPGAPPAATRFSQFRRAL